MPACCVINGRRWRLLKTLRFVRILTVLVFGVVFLVLASGAYALTLKLEPAKTQREVNGKVRVHIYAEGAVSLISMGVTVTFNPAVLQMASASKYEQNADTGWVMDADGNAATTGDQYRTPAVEIDNTNGVVRMIGGNLNGTNTTGFSGKVLLGWIVFNAVGNGSSNLTVALGREAPFSNFVRLDKTVDEPTNFGNLGIICVMPGAHPGDVNGNNYVEPGDYALMRAAMNKGFPNPAYNVSADLNANAYVEPGDYAILRAHMNKACLPCQ